MKGSKYNKKFGDIWLRARHNALANLEAAEEASKKVVVFEIIISFLIILPIASTILAKVCLFFSTWDVVFSLIGGLGALYFSLVGFVQSARRKDDYHRRAHSIFNNIAQKARRGDNPSLEESECQYLIRSLEEMFETAKSNSYEPSDENYNNGWKRLKNMPKLPFGLEIDKRKGSSLNKFSEDIFNLYESLKTEDVHSSWISSINFDGKKVLDLGAGSGRDAAYLASKGTELVVAVDSSCEMLSLAKQKHGDKKIIWMNESLPDLSSLDSVSLGSFDFILCSAVLMFLDENAQVASLKTILRLLKKGGTAVVTIKSDKRNKEIFPLTPQFAKIITDSGATFEKLSGERDLFNRDGISWNVFKVTK
ncbi:MULTISPECIES: class I SAM-dependent methyltransferase [Pseudoalteromonas]|uniref:class I SAM-dependent methyltransferase n=1 Tax=Pseudoalteromonas TaxID=53246 RepID=UPI001EFECD21|nr:class I SAM-dependent methyltransferase [Pseudoalteromonas sp. Isolate6]MCG9759931.1 class I SAM-dependent methyltransferase [Pseudoalteromonas sp. Isolate6]